MISLRSLKIVVLVTLFVITIIATWIPLWIFRKFRTLKDKEERHRFRSAISLTSCFGAGVFLATCMLDLFPEVNSKFADAMTEIPSLATFPIAEFVTMVGLFCILFVEQLAISCSRELHHHRYQEEDDLEKLNDGEMYDSQSESSNNIDENEKNRLDSHSQSVTRSVILLAALSIHSVLEGMAIGLQNLRHEVLQVFAAIILHKSILAFSLGTNLLQSQLEWRTVIGSAIGFATASPLGIAIGIIITHIVVEGVEADLVLGVLQGLACGTFLYVVFFEILPHEFHTRRRHPSRLIKVFFLVIGFGVVTLSLFINPVEVKPLCPDSAALKG